MAIVSLPTASFSLDAGFYRLNVRNGDAAMAVELVDRNNPLRACLLFAQSAAQTYFLHLQHPLYNGMIVMHHPDADQPPPSGNPSLEWTRISKAAYYAVGLLAATKSRRLQRFGPGEKLLVTGGSADNLASFASQNVEFRYLRMYGLDDRSIKDKGWEHLFDAAQPLSNQKHVRMEAVDHRACVYVHMHYWETWPEIEAILLTECTGMDVIVTSSVQADQHFAKIAALFPQAQLIETENRGRDVGPFIELVSKGVFDHYNAVCKIHGKLSKKHGKETVSGLRVRRYILASLLANGNGSRAVEAFADRSDLGLIGPENLLLPPAGAAVKAYIKSEWPIMKRVFKRANIDVAPKDIVFFAGTMFWFRPAALSILQKMNMSLGDFDRENGAKRSTLQHSFERMFCTFVKSAGYKVDVFSPSSPSAETFEADNLNA
ncbi:hypothetical protein H4S14_001753 [Agrobacterium vitis]|nr:hypothetical protein [Agrobacterium vitis]MBE1438009.1 hypothetical protein [Agrobacterium vitis]